MAKSPKRDLLEQAAMPPDLERTVARLVDARLVELGLLDPKRCATCENWCPVGKHCFKFDAAVPEHVQKTGCEHWIVSVLF